MRAVQEANLHASTRPAIDEIEGFDYETEPPRAVRESGEQIVARPDKFPRTAIVLEVATLADLCRLAGRALDRLAANAPNYEPSTLRREAHGLVRVLFAEVGKVVTL